MVRADGQVTKVHYKGEQDDFIVIVESAEAVREWKSDKSKPLVDVVDSFDVFITHGHGTQGTLDRASKAQLENEFGTKSSDDAVQQILEKGSVQESQSKAKTGVTNESNGPGIGGSGSGVHN